MGRRLKLGIGVVAALLALLALNTLILDGETKEAEVTAAGGRILDLPGGEMQVVERGHSDAEPIVLIHCFTCAIDWWDGMIPRLARQHRVVAVDLLGHGGSEKPTSGYSMPNQAEMVGQALERLGVRDATVVGHSLGGTVAVALAERFPQVVERIAIIDEPPTTGEGDLGFVAGLVFVPVIGETAWRLKTDFSIRDGLEVAFAPGFEVPDSFIEDVKRMTYSSYDGSPAAFEEYTAEAPLDRRLSRIGKPLLVIVGAEEQIIDDPERVLKVYSEANPEAATHLLAGAGHSPNVERPARTAKLVLKFANDPLEGVGSTPKDGSGRGARPPQSSPTTSSNRASGVRSATAHQ